MADNIDYTTLKKLIKVHTTKGQGRAIAIPGHENTALRRFEDDFYCELCDQHDRIQGFVADLIFEGNIELGMLCDPLLLPGHVESGYLWPL